MAQINHFVNESPIDAASALLQGLNQQQIAAVTAPCTGSVLVLAGAGCGKTHVLVRRLGYCLSRGVTSERVLALTFTRCAAQEMTQRVGESTFFQSGQSPPLCTTFHALSLTILRTVCDGHTGFGYLGYGSEPRCIEPQESLALAAREVTPAERRALGVDPRGCAELLARYRVHPQGLGSPGESRLHLLSTIEDRLSRVRKNRGIWDFADLLHGALVLLRDHPSVRRRWVGAFDAIMVDEFQDTNPIQIALVREFMASGAHLYAVGDDDQAIYGFRGGDIGAIISFPEAFSPAVVVKMEVNYRSTPLILRAANRVFCAKPPHLRKILKTGVTTASKPYPLAKRHFADLERMADWIRDRIERLVHAGEYATKDCALLFRTNEQKDHLMKLICRGAAIDGVHFLTVHAAKGLEFAIVFVCGLQEGEFPLYRQPRTRNLSLLKRALIWLGLMLPPLPPDCRLDEELRLFYVALTRARERLFLLTARQTIHFGRHRRASPSRFLRRV